MTSPANASLPSFSEETWKQLLGSTNWSGFLEPNNLNDDLRRLILHCGAFCQAAYDVYDHSKSTEGADRVSLELDNINLPVPHRYKKHAFLYATTLPQKIVHYIMKLIKSGHRENAPKLMGYCAATTDNVSRAIKRREIYIAWRGTKAMFEWKNNLLFLQRSAKFLLRDFDRRREDKPRIMMGWRSIYTSTYKADHSSSEKSSARDEFKAKVGQLLRGYKGENISIVLTGHSLGGILAILSAFDLVENIIPDQPGISVAAVVFGCPKVGNEAFKRRVERHSNLKILHIRNKKDIVPQLPEGVLHKYVRLGSELVIDTDNSPIPSLNISKKLGKWHDLQTTLHKVEEGQNVLRGLHTTMSFLYADSETTLRQNVLRRLHTTESFRYADSEIELWSKRAEGIQPIAKKLSQFTEKIKSLN